MKRHKRNSKRLYQRKTRKSSRRSVRRNIGKNYYAIKNKQNSLWWGNQSNDPYAFRESWGAWGNKTRWVNKAEAIKFAKAVRGDAYQVFASGHKTKV